jgi:hypothetical protein
MTSGTGLRMILIGLDGSPEGEAAVQLSLRWARRLAPGWWASVSSMSPPSAGRNRSR